MSMGGWFLGANPHEWQGWALGFSLDSCWPVYMEVPAQRPSQSPGPRHSCCPCQGRWSERNRNERLGCLSQRVNDHHVFRALEPPSEIPSTCAVWTGG